MKKIFTLVAAAFMAASVNAQTVLYVNADAGTNADGYSTISYDDGASLVLNGNSGKSYSKGVSMELDGESVLTTKVSNGAQNTFYAPEGKKVSKVQFFAYVNIKEEKLNYETYPTTGFRTSFWKEVNGETYTTETTNEITKRDALEESVFNLPGVSSFTFTNTGEQLCFVLKITYGEGTGINAIEADKTVNTPAYNVAGQRVSDNAKGLIIKNGKKVIR